jgi:hypothetical protein
MMGSAGSTPFLQWPSPAGHDFGGKGDQCPRIAVPTPHPTSRWGHLIGVEEAG